MPTFFSDRSQPLNPSYNDFLSAAEDYPELLSKVFAFMGYASRGSGAISQYQIDEALRFMAVLRLGDAARHQVIEAFNQGKSDNFNLAENYIVLLASSDLGPGLYRAVAYVAVADGRLTPDKKKRLQEVGNLLLVSKAECLSIAGQYKDRVNQALKDEKDRLKALEREEKARIKAEKAEQKAEEKRQREAQKAVEREQKAREKEEKARIKAAERQRRLEERERLKAEKERLRLEAKAIRIEDLPDPDGTLEVYRLLGVSKGAPAEEIHGAYKRMLMRYHPDRMTANGINPALKDFYNLRTEEVRLAYQLIRDGQI